MAFACHDIAAAEPTNRVRRLQHSVVPCATVALSVRSCRPYTFLDRLLSDEDGAPRAHVQARGTGPTPQIRFYPMLRPLAVHLFRAAGADGAR